MKRKENNLCYNQKELNIEDHMAKAMKENPKLVMKYHLVNSVYKLLKANTLQLDKLKLLVSFYQDIQIDKDKFGLEFILHIVKQRNLLKFVWVLVKVPQINGLQS